MPLISVGLLLQHNPPPIYWFINVQMLLSELVLLSFSYLLAYFTFFIYLFIRFTSRSQPPSSFQCPLTQPLPMSHAPCPLPFSSEKWKPLHINSPGSSCWETQMKSKLHICYIDAGGLGSAHACSLVSGSYIYNRHNYSLWGFKTVSGNLHQVLCLWFLIFPLYCPNCRDWRWVSPSAAVYSL